MDDSPAPRRSSLHIVLIAAIVQGWSLYGLSWSVDHNAWPSGNSGLLMALYALVTVAPLTLQILVEHSAQRLTWILAAATGLAFAVFGWHFGHNISNQPGKGFFDHDSAWPQLMAGLVLWFLSIPFLQARLLTARWWPQYTVFFAQACRNVLTLVEAALFTVIFWGLLELCDALFEMLGVTFFRELYRKEIFSIPVTWLTIGVSLHLIAGLDNLTTVALRQIHNVLKWLAIPAVLIVAFFTVALVLSLPGLVGSGKRAIDASTLLWLVAVVVLLLNSGYGDGETEQPYSRMIGTAIRALVPLLYIIALIATWNLFIRTRAYGITVERAWGWLVAAAAIAFSGGYSWCALRKDRWMRGMSRVNLVVVLGIVGAIALALTPILSPYRLAANSQYRVVLASQPPARKTHEQWRSDELRTLRFSAGEYGRAKLRGLGASASVPKDISENATLALADDYPRWDGYGSGTARESIDRVPLYPKGHALPDGLKNAIAADTKARGLVAYLSPSAQSYGVFIDLTGDGQEDFALLNYSNGVLYVQDAGAWKFHGVLSANDNCPLASFVKELGAGHFAARVPRLPELTIGNHAYGVRPDATTCQ